MAKHILIMNDGTDESKNLADLTPLQLAAIKESLETLEEDGRHTNGENEKQIHEVMDMVEKLLEEKGFPPGPKYSSIVPYSEDNGWVWH